MGVGVNEGRGFVLWLTGLSGAGKTTLAGRLVPELLARNGVAAVTAAISPYREVREEVRRAVEGDGAEFVEVYVECPLEVLAERDVKGLYKKALAGEIQGFTGVSDPYEAPPAPDVAVRTHEETVEASATRIVLELERRGLLTTRFGVEELVVQGGANGHEHRTDI